MAVSNWTLIVWSVSNWAIKVRPIPYGSIEWWPIPNRTVKVRSISYWTIKVGPISHWAIKRRSISNRPVEIRPSAAWALKRSIPHRTLFRPKFPRAFKRSVANASVEIVSKLLRAVPVILRPVFERAGKVADGVIRVVIVGRSSEGPGKVLARRKGLEFVLIEDGAAVFRRSADGLQIGPGCLGVPFGEVISRRVGRMGVGRMGGGGVGERWGGVFPMTDDRGGVDLCLPESDLDSTGTWK